MDEWTFHVHQLLRRLAVPTRPGVVRSAPSLTGTFRVRLPSASSHRCDGQEANVLVGRGALATAHGARLVRVGGLACDVERSRSQLPLRGCFVHQRGARIFWKGLTVSAGSNCWSMTR
jgi:hypothetical protein